ncbi:(2Fe-2S)-binding protein [Limnohabitans sp. MMS-10A-178]|uniref:(2Fe-2S)-binding protein n=1 Tax=Limnohabitans sp. MMS-10A-178 TaxID=1835767 RepID=UPI003513859B
MSDQQSDTGLNIKLQVNGQPVHAQVSVRQHLGDFLRESQGFKGTHIGCEHGVCGACTVQVDGRAVRSCLTLAVQADAAQVFTIEGLSDDPVVRALQDSFVRCHAMQCGFCTAGMLLTAAELLQAQLEPSRDEVREYLSGNYCRCTGYESIVNAVMDAAQTLREASGE